MTPFLKGRGGLENLFYPGFYSLSCRALPLLRQKQVKEKQKRIHAHQICYWQKLFEWKLDQQSVFNVSFFMKSPPTSHLIKKINVPLTGRKNVQEILILEKISTGL